MSQRGWTWYVGPQVVPGIPELMPNGIVLFTALSCHVTAHAGTWMFHLVVFNLQLSFGWVDK